MKRKIRLSLVHLLVITLATAVLQAQPKQLDATRLQIEIDRLGVVGAALYVAAHPDDENTALLAWLVNEKKVRTGYLSMTRGEGGQNLIGSEKGTLLGVIRAEELLAARRIDGAEQFFTDAVDFGYSKSADETLAFWNREKTLGDFVRVIRTFRPDIIITRFPPDGRGGHGQHTASAILAEEAFAAAADPKRFPEQLTGKSALRPWQAKRVVWNVFVPQRPGAPLPTVSPLAIDVGSYNEQLGRSYSELAGESRSKHKSQGFGSPERRGPLPVDFQHRAGTEAKSDIFEGIDLSWKRVRGGEAVGRSLSRASAEFDPRNPSAVIPRLVAAHDALSRLDQDDPEVADKLRAVSEAIRQAAGIWIEAITGDSSAVAGETVPVKVTVLNRSPVEAELVAIEGASANLESPARQAVLTPNTPVSVDATIILPADVVIASAESRLIPRDSIDRDGDGAILVRVLLRIAGETIAYEVPVEHRYVDRVRGEVYQPLEILPAVTVRAERGVLLFPDRAQRTLELTAVAHSDSVERATIELPVPAGWRVEPRALEVTFAKDRREATVAVSITPPAAPSAVTLSPHLGGGEPGLEAIAIDYEHIRPRTALLPLATRLVRSDITRAGRRVGYIMGAGDEVPRALEEIGYEVHLLTDSDLESEDLQQFDAIVAGVRAFNTRRRLREAHDRLMQYVERGGIFIVQYNTSDSTLIQPLGPYPIKLSRDRVTREEAPVTFLDPADPLLNVPNRITASDFEGWVQERGLYFAGEWDERYRPLLGMNDPGEKETRGSLVAARHGKGLYIYTGLALFRQLPAGVPGAYRLLANLIAGGRAAAR